METKKIEEKYALEYIRDTLNTYKKINNDEYFKYYHHNVDYKDTPSVVKHGILPLKDLNELKLRNDSYYALKAMSNEESHINGIDGVSLAKTDLTDLYKDEEEYNPFINNQTDIIVDSNIEARRRTMHYGNEFVYKGIITPNMFKSIDIRLLKHLNNTKDEDIIKIVKNYNEIIDIARSMKEYDLDVNLREMSEKQKYALDYESLAKEEKISIK